MRPLLAATASFVLLAGCGAQAGTDGVGFEGGDGTVTIVPVADRRPAPTLAGVSLSGDEVSTADHWSEIAGLRKHDLVSGKVERHDVGPARAAGEAVFVPATPDAGEDHGWVLTVVYDATRDSSDVLVIDATDFEAAPVATIQLPRRVPFGFHGTWIPGASLT